MVRVRFRGLVGVSDPLVPCLTRRQGKVIAPQQYGRGFELNNGMSPLSPTLTPHLNPISRVRSSSGYCLRTCTTPVMNGCNVQ